MWAPPERLAIQFEFLRPLGHGGMGYVFLARHLDLGRLVAIKILKLDGEEQIRERFLREARSMARVQHPNIPRIYSYGPTDQGPYLEMEYLEGKTLLELAESESPLPAMLQVASGLEAIHAEGLVHRDVKPANVLVTPAGRAVLLDFGLAFDPLEDRLTRPDGFVGTMAYLAPEIFTGDPATPAADWFAWGVTLFFLLEKELPYQVPLVIQAASGRELAPPTFRNLSPDSGEAQLLRALLSSDPEARPSNRSQIELLLESPCPPVSFDADAPTSREFSSSILAQTAIEAPSSPPAPVRKKRLGPLLGLVALVLLLILRPRPPEAPTPSPGPALPTLAPTSPPVLPPAPSPPPPPPPEGSPVERPEAVAAPEIEPISGESSPPQPGELPRGALARLGSTLRKHRKVATVVRYSPDGLLLASGGYDNRILLWQASRGSFHRHLPGHASAVHDLAFSPDGKHLASCGDDREIHVYELESGQSALVLQAHSREIRSIRFGPSGDQLISTSVDGSIRVHRFPSGDPVSNLWVPASRSSGASRAATLSPRGRTALLPGEGSWELHQPLRERASQPLPMTFRGASALSLDGSYLACGQARGLIDLIALSAPDQPTQLRGHDREVVALAFSPDGKRLASSGLDRRLIVQDLEAPFSKNRFWLGDSWTGSLCFRPDGQELAAAVGTAIRLFDLVSGKERGLESGHRGPVRSLEFSTSGDVLASGGDDGLIVLWDVQGKRSRHSLGPTLDLADQPLPVLDLALRPQADQLLASSSNSELMIWNTHSGIREGTLEGHGTGNIHLSANASGEDLASASRDGTLIFWNLPERTPKLWLESHKGEVLALVRSQDLLASYGDDGLIKLWDSVTGDARGQLQPPSRLRSLCLLEQGQKLVGGTAEGTLLVWDLQGSRQPTTLRGHRGPVLALASPATGGWFASAGSDGEVVLWNERTDLEMARYPSYQGKIHALAASRKGDLLASGGEDETVLLWGVRQRP